MNENIFFKYLDQIAEAYNMAKYDTEDAFEEGDIRVFNNKEQIFEWLFTEDIEDCRHYINMTKYLTKEKLKGRTVIDTLLEEDERIKFISDDCITFMYM